MFRKEMRHFGQMVGMRDLVGMARLLNPIGAPSVKEGILNCKDNTSFTIETDGVPFLEFFTVSIWPTCLILNDSPPYTKGMAKEPMMLSGLWFGENIL